MDTPQERLRLFVEKIGMSQAEVARAIGLYPQSFSKYLSVSSPKVIKNDEVLQKLTDLGLNKHWYRTGEGEMLSVKDIRFNIEKIEDKNGVIMYKSKGFVEVPTIESAFPCGVPVANEGNIVKMLFLQEFVEGINHPYIIKCVGDSMLPTIEDGDYAISETINGDMSRITDGNIVVAYLREGFTIKRIFKHGEQFLLVPDNVITHKPYMIEPGDDAKLVGLVKRIIKAV